MKIDQMIDLRGVSCPLNYVMTKLRLEKMREGDVLQVLLDDGDPVVHVPRSAKEEGHRILEVEQRGSYFMVLMRKRAEV